MSTRPLSPPSLLPYTREYIRGGQRTTYVQHVTPVDVLCGRGHGPNDHSGNTFFRSLVKDILQKYKSSSRHGDKTKMARHVVAIIHSKNGRFLRKLEGAEKERLLIGANNTSPRCQQPQEADIYAVVDDECLLIQKTKQAFRHYLRREEASALSPLSPPAARKTKACKAPSNAAVAQEKKNLASRKKLTAPKKEGNAAVNHNLCDGFKKKQDPELAANISSQQKKSSQSLLRGCDAQHHSMRNVKFPSSTNLDHGRHATNIQKLQQQPMVANTAPSAAAAAAATQKLLLEEAANKKRETLFLQQVLLQSSDPFIVQAATERLLITRGRLPVPSNILAGKK